MKKTIRILPAIFISSFFVLVFVLTGNGQEKPVKRLFDEYGDLKSNGEKAKLEGYFIELNNNPSAEAYVVISAPARRQRPREAFIIAFAKERGIDRYRLTLRFKPARTVSTQLWVVPPGADPPQ